MQLFGAPVAFSPQLLQQPDKTILLLVRVYRDRVGGQDVHVPYFPCPPPQAAQVPQRAPLIPFGIEAQSVKG